MTAPTNTRRTRKSATTATDAPVTAPDTTPAPESTDAVPTPDAGTVAPVATVPTPAYVIPDWTPETDQAAYVAGVGTTYRDADKTAKAAMRSAWGKFQSDALNDLDMGKLALVRDINAVLVSSKPVVEVDPADAYLVRIAALRLAADALTDAFRTDHGDEAADALTARMQSDLTESEVTAISTMRDKLAVVPSNRRTGPQRSVEAHIRSALEAAPAGTILTCAQIHNHRSDAYGPDESPSVGAVGAAHGREMDGVVSTVNDAKVKGFKLA